jgi:hypothetical protein
METALIQPIYKGKGNQREVENTGGFHDYRLLGKIYSGIVARRLRGCLLHHNKPTFLQMGFTEGRRTVDNVFVMTCADKYSRAKRGRLEGCSVDFENEFDVINR